MRYSSHQPASPLGDFVHNFWHCADAPSHPRERILPSGTIELVVNLQEDEVRICDSAQPSLYRRFPGIVVSGTYAGAFDIDPSQHASMMGVHFRPGGAFPFFGAAVGELASSHLGGPLGKASYRASRAPVCRRNISETISDSGGDAQISVAMVIRTPGGFAGP